MGTVRETGGERTGKNANVDDTIPWLNTLMNEFNPKITRHFFFFFEIITRH